MKRSQSQLFIFKFWFLSAITCVGGITKIDEDREKLEGAKCPEIVVATPGRFEDLIKRSDPIKQKLKSVEVLIVDEADQMLDIGFERAINLILATMPKQRRTGLFSATLNENVLRYVRIILFLTSRLRGGSFSNF